MGVGLVFKGGLGSSYKRFFNVQIPNSIETFLNAN